MKMKKISSIILTAAVSASVILPGTTALAYTDLGEPESFEELYANQLVNYLDHQYYFDGQAIPLPESNFYFINSFLELSNYANMGYYPQTALNYIDLAAEYPGDEYATFGDYFVKYAENSLESTCILCARAEAEDVTLSDDTKADIDALIEEIKTGKAALSDMTLDDYLQFYYGPGNTEANFRKVLDRYYLADAYSKEYCAKYEFSEEEKNVPNIRYALFYAPDTAEQDVKDKALEDANKMKEACKSIDDLTTLAQAAQEEGTVYDQGDIAVPKGKTVAKFEEWAYGEDRKEGELDVIYAPEYGYFVVGYLGLQPQSQDALDQVALKALSNELLEEINSETHEFYTNDAYAPAPAGPTPTPVPEVAVPTDPVFDPYATTPSGTDTETTPQNTGTTDVLVIVFITLAGVAIAAVIVILIAYAIKNSKNGKNISDDEFDDEIDEKPVKEEKSSAKKAAEPEEEEDDFIDGSDDADNDVWKKPGKDDKETEDSKEGSEEKSEDEE